MDLKVVGTMGLTDDDIQALKELPETDTVEGAYSTDVICGETDSQKVLHVESPNKEVNHLEHNRRKTSPKERGVLPGFRVCVVPEIFDRRQGCYPTARRL